MRGCRGDGEREVDGVDGGCEDRARDIVAWVETSGGEGASAQDAGVSGFGCYFSGLLAILSIGN